MPRPIYSQRGGPGRGLSDGAIDTAEMASAAITESKLGADSAGLTAVADPVRRRSMTVFCGAAITAATNYPLMRAGAEAPRITGCYVNCGVQMYHAAGEADTWIFQVRNTTRSQSLLANNASLSNLTLTVTAWKSLPMNNNNSTLQSGNSVQLQLTESGTAQTIDRLVCMIEWQPTVNT